MCPQSGVPSRTNSALVKAAKDIVMVKRPTQMPLREARSALWSPYRWQSGAGAWQNYCVRINC